MLQKIILKIIIAFSAIIAIFTFGFFKGKNDKENEENKTAADQIRKFNRIKRDTARLSDVELDAKLQKWKDAHNKHGSL